jgi:o-succinylbenzoate---CoA ligase
MRLFIQGVPFSIQSENDLEMLDVSVFNSNEKKAYLFLKSWFKNDIFTFNSSGSTGEPKPFQFTKEEIQWSANQTINYLKLDKTHQHFYICLDVNMVAGAMLLARSIVLHADVSIVVPSANPFEGVLKDHPYTFTSLVPLQFQQTLETNQGSEVLNQFEHILIGGAPIAEIVARKASQLEAQVWATYGMTETLSHIALRNLKSEQEFKLLSGNQIAYTENYTIQIKNPLTQNQWLKTNDLVEISETGFVVLGRLDFVVNTGGYKVNVLKVEECIEVFFVSKQMETNKFFVGSIPDDALGERLVLFLEEKMVEKPQLEELKGYLGTRLKKHEIPKQIITVSTFYYTISQKLDRAKTKKTALI